MDERLKVLVVDDEVSLCLSTATLLAEDFQVRTASSAEEALRLLGAHDFDVLCADLRLSGCGGLELLRLASVSHPGLSGVLVTGHREDLTRRAGVEARRLLHLVLKPYHPFELLTLVRRAGEESRLWRAMGALGGGWGARGWVQ
ncbi:response regulator [Myxococcaceae bacterium GXIMD 01537]